MREKINVRDICLIGLFAALTAAMAQLSIPMPFGVPMTMQTFAVMLAGIVLGARNGALSAVIYAAAGCAGFPVFSNFSGGAGVLFGGTGGFILSFPIMAWFAGLGAQRKGAFNMTAGLVCGTLINFLSGMAGFSLVTGSSLSVSFSACVLPFIPGAAVKSLGAALLGGKIKQRVSLIQ